MVHQSRLVHTDRCIRSHLGGWFASEDFVKSAVKAIKDGLMPMRASMSEEDDEAEPRSKKEFQDLLMRMPPCAATMVEERGRLLYAVEKNGVAVIPIHGVLMKGESKFSNTVNTQRVIRAIDRLIDDNSVGSAMLYIDSPGGSIAGMTEVIDKIKEASKVKPFDAHVEDEACSGGQWLCFACENVTATRNSIVGSVGAVWVAVDSSEAAKMEGIKVIPITTGTLKAAGADGTPLTPEIIDYYKGLLVQLFEPFRKDAVKKLGAKAKDVMATAQVYHVSEGKEIGLVTRIGTMEEALESSGKRAKAVLGVQKVGKVVAAAR